MISVLLDRRKTFQATGIALAAVVAFWFDFDLEGTEFSGGWFTGRLLQIHGTGTILLLLALCLTYVLPRAAAVIAFLACLLCLPLHVLSFAPGPIHYLAGGEWSVPATSNFTWDWPAVVGTGSLIFAASFCFRGVSRSVVAGQSRRN